MFKAISPLDLAVSIQDGSTGSAGEGFSEANLEKAFDEVVTESRPDAPITILYRLCIQDEAPTEAQVLEMFRKLRGKVQLRAEHFEELQRGGE